MPYEIQRRQFMQLGIAGTAAVLGTAHLASAGGPAATRLISPGCRRTKVKVARLYLGTPGGLWPGPKLDLQAEVRRYQTVFDEIKDEVADVDFTVDRLITSASEVEPIRDALKSADGILVIHLNMGISPILTAILGVGTPTMVFAIPYSGHEWSGWGAQMSQPPGARMDCLLTSDVKQLAAAVRPFRAIHHLREAKILNVAEGQSAQYAQQIRDKFGTEIKQVGLDQVVAAFNAVDEAQARAETDRWIREAFQVVEPSAEGIYKSCRQALAFEKMLADEEATVMAVDCYGSMWNKTIRLPAYPCLGLSRLNSMGLGGICESDLPCAMTHIILQGLTGRPGFISDPTMDESTNSIILAHCMAARRMLGPQQPAAPYKLRTVHERQEGVTPQVKLPVGLKATQAKLVGTDMLLYFTGQVTDSPDCDRGCRNKLVVRVDGDAEKLWRHWSCGLHRVTCYGDLRKTWSGFVG